MMTIEKSKITVRGILVEIVWKDIKNLHLGVYPPSGRVRVAAPLRLSNEAVRLAIASRLGWIRKKQKGFKRQNRQSKREMITGESHYFMGKRYRLNVIERNAPPAVTISNNSTIELSVRPGADRNKREAVLLKWYRKKLKEQISRLITNWESVIGIKVSEWGVKKMKTLWGSCNSEAKRIWINLELAKKPPKCLEYILVHEMLHFIERHHNERFKTLMDEFMPRWRLCQDELNRVPLAHEDWQY